MSQEYMYPDEEPVDGLPMTIEAFEEFVDRVGGGFHYELIDGVVHNMADPSIEHGEIAYNIRHSLNEQLGDSGPCRVIQEYRVKIPNHASVRPDVLLTCDLSDWNPKERAKKHHRIQSPLIVVEILSPSTKRYDRGKKFERYQLCATLEVYILVHQNKPLVEVYRRSTGWQKEQFNDSQIIKLDQLDLELPLKDIYRRVFSL